jgi:uncharacterized protein YqgV (UPF0045/DUF77 family)
MLVEFRVVPMGHHRSDEWHDRVAELLRASGLHFEQGPMSVCIEGEWAKVMDAIHRCHEAGFALSSHVLSSITVNELRRQTTPGEEPPSDGIGRRVPRKGMDAEC